MISSQRERGSVVTSIIHPPSSFFVHCIKVITMTPKWAGWHLQSPASWSFTQAFIQAQIKENIKGPRHWPLWGELPVTDEFPAQKASNAENVSIWRHHVRVRLLHITNFSADVKHLLGVTLEIRYSCTRMLANSIVFPVRKQLTCDSLILNDRSFCGWNFKVPDISRTNNRILCPKTPQETNEVHIFTCVLCLTINQSVSVNAGYLVFKKFLY